MNTHIAASYLRSPKSRNSPVKAKFKVALKATDSGNTLLPLEHSTAGDFVVSGLAIAVYGDGRARIVDEIPTELELYQLQ